MIVKVKEPLAVERKRLRRGQVLFTYLHLAPDRAQTEDLLKSGVTAIAYETVTSPTGTLPLLTPMSEIAGRLAPQVGAHYLERTAGGRGVLLYLAQEGRGIGLVNKLRAYELQDEGFDTIDANEQLGFDADERIYAPAATVLSRMGIKRVRLMTNNPHKISQLERYGVEVAERVAHSFPANGHNENYLRTKAERAGHML